MRIICIDISILITTAFLVFKIDIESVSFAINNKTVFSVLDR